MKDLKNCFILLLWSENVSLKGKLVDLSAPPAGRLIQVQLNVHNSNAESLCNTHMIHHVIY